MGFAVVRLETCDTEHVLPLPLLLVGTRLLSSLSNLLQSADGEWLIQTPSYICAEVASGKNFSAWNGVWNLDGEVGHV